MKYQGVVLLSVRTYLGIFDGTDNWEFLKYVVGIKLGQGKVVDYKTGDVYDYISRTKNGKLAVNRCDVKKGTTYAVESIDGTLDKKAIYSDKQIDSYIKNSPILTKEYKSIGKKKVKVIIKKI